VANLSLESALASANETIKELKEEIAKLQGELHKTETNLMAERAEKERLLTAQKDEREESDQNKFALENDLRKARDELTGKIVEIKTYEDANQRLKQDIEQQKRDLRTKEEKIRELEQTRDKLREFEEKLRITENELNNTRRQLEDRNQRVQELTNQNTQHITAHADIEERLHISEANHRKTIDALDEINKEKESLAIDLHQHKQEIKTLREANEDLITQLEHSREELYSQRNQVDVERKQRFDLEQSLMDMKKFMGPDNRVKILLALETTQKMTLKSLSAATGIMPVEIKRILEGLENTQYVQLNIHDEIELLRLPWAYTTKE